MGERAPDDDGPTIKPISTRRVMLRIVKRTRPVPVLFREGDD
jgi:hypothetical protein